MPFEIRKSEEITCREDFALLCNWRRLVRAVEVGTEFGNFAAAFMSRWEGELLICVDDYEIHADDFQLGNRMPDLLAATAALAPYGRRARIVKATSLDAARDHFKWFGPEFIYIDAAHDYESVVADIRAWWERLSPIGVLAGHDFASDQPGVVRAVTEFAQEKDLLVRVTDDYPESWYVYKNEPGPDWKRVHRDCWSVEPCTSPQ